MKRFLIHTLGCRLNQAESDQIIQKLYEEGYVLVQKDQPAELCIINTCAVTHEAEVKCRKIIRQLLRGNPTAIIVVIGCYVERDIGAIRNIEGIDLIVDNKCKLKWLSDIPTKKLVKPRIVTEGEWKGESISFEPVLPPFSIPSFHRANVKIQEGCDCKCSYCIIPHLRGPSRSRAIEEILKEIEWRLEGGTKEIVLTGVNIGNYNWQGSNLINLLDAIHCRFGEKKCFRIRLSSIELNTLNDEYILRMRDKKYPLVPYLHIPLQSGCNTILRSMNRPYVREEYEDFVLKAVEMVEDIGISADIMVGFPGETERDFEETLSFLNRLPIYFMHVFPFSPREGTLAYSMENKVKPIEIERRVKEVIRLSKRKREEFHKRNINKVKEVLFEERENSSWSGYSENYIRVFLDSDANLENKMCLVKLEENDSFSMKGSLVEVKF
ncbi:MAG: tRNA (N(6)-L-threonylcarbamoyladenosine(37)-C(2))-methylthiotransferase MtaB [Candidatus Hydrogenedentes bacterium]|nr:tRNA (N(6)-L-threonylcarbamoyladenosine(37)-C(2))-methylthiotransferase MtaB [Candidatus Hydrogenedentota bacterium]